MSFAVAKSKKMKNEIERLIQLGIIEEARVNNGKVFRICSKRMFDAEEGRKWKNGVEAALEEYDSKSDYAINSNDSKSGAVSYPTVPIRILNYQNVTLDGTPMTNENTNSIGIFFFYLVMIENKESFLFGDSYFPDASAILYYSGRTSKRWYEWLQSNTETIIFAPDYDPVGIEEYLIHKNYLSNRIILYKPENLEELFKHGKNSLYSDQYHVLTRISKQSYSEEIESILDLIRHYKKGVEQEVIFKPRSDS